jgi:hypothetical protein
MGKNGIAQTVRDALGNPHANVDVVNTLVNELATADLDVPARAKQGEKSEAVTTDRDRHAGTHFCAVQNTPYTAHERRGVEHTVHSPPTTRSPQDGARVKTPHGHGRHKTRSGLAHSLNGADGTRQDSTRTRKHSSDTKHVLRLSHSMGQLDGKSRLVDLMSITRPTTPASTRVFRSKNCVSAEQTTLLSDDASPCPDPHWPVYNTHTTTTPDSNLSAG